MLDYKDKWQTVEEKAIIKTACELSLKRYIRFIHKYTTNTDYTFQPFHNDIINSLEAIANQDTDKNLLINMPVGFGKSLIVEYFISWCFARDKNNTFLYTSYADKLITKLSKEIKDIIESGPYEWLFNYKLEKDEKSKVNWSIGGSIKRSGLTAGAMGGTITGLDAGNPAVEGFSGALVIDDPISAIKVIYENSRADCVYKYNSGLKTRLRRNDVPIILIMQRLDEEDLTGYILDKEKDGWDVLTIKALVDGKSIWEEKISTEKLNAIREDTPQIFFSQYQQEPNNNITSLFPSAKFTSDTRLLNGGICHIDKAFGGEDYTCLTIMKERGGKIYAYGKMWDKHIDDCIEEIKEARERFQAGTIHTETNDDKGYFKRNNRDLLITTYHEKMNKHYKIMNFLYSNWKDIFWIEDTDTAYLKQIASYSETSKHDDSPDSAASLVRILRPLKIKTQVELSHRFI